MKKTIQLFTNEDTFYQKAVELIISLAEKSINEKKHFNFVLSGGSTPRSLYNLLSTNQYRSLFPWDKTTFFIGDERWVPYQHPDSNYAMINHHLIMPLKIPNINFITIPYHNHSPAACARIYEQNIRDYFQPNHTDKKKRIPSFDLILLGMGDDGHTVSLFPNNHKALEEKNHWVIEVYAPTGKPPGYRITLTLPLINKSKNILFLISGSNKKTIFNEIIEHPRKSKLRYPAAKIRALHNLYWYYCE